MGKYKHGHCTGEETRTYGIWRGMVTRCTNKKNHNYAKYGAKGITVCDRWLVFENFLADMGEAPLDLSIDRKDSTLGYDKDNCRWSTTVEQAINRSSTIMVDLNGTLMPLKHAAKAVGVGYTTVWQRLSRGWTLQVALGLSTKE